VHAALPESWISLDMQTIQREALIKTKRAALNGVFELPLTRGYQTSKCSPLSLAIYCLTYIISIICKIIKKSCHNYAKISDPGDVTVVNDLANPHNDLESPINLTLLLRNLESNTSSVDIKNIFS
jgi:hypothetical protein